MAVFALECGHSSCIRAWVAYRWKSSVENRSCCNPASERHRSFNFAAEGLLESFVESDLRFAGSSAVMVNLSDIASMIGRQMGVMRIANTEDGDSVVLESAEGELLCEISISPGRLRRSR